MQVSLAVLLLLIPSAASRPGQVVNIGLLIQNETIRDIYPLDTVDAANFAISDWAPLFKYTLNVTLNLMTLVQPFEDDSNSAGMSAALDFVKQGASVLLGGGGSLSCTAYIGAGCYSKVPVMAITGCLDDAFLDKRTYPTFARMYGSSSVAFVGRDLYVKFKVKTPQLIMIASYEQPIAAASFIFNAVGTYPRPFMILDASASPEVIRGFLRQIKANGDRWIVLLLPHATARNVLIEMDGMGMNSGFAVVQLGMTATAMYDPTDTPERNAAALRAVEGVFTVATDRNIGANYNTFANRLNATSCARGNCLKTFSVDDFETTSLLLSSEVYDSVSIACYALYTLLNSTTATINPQQYGTTLYQLMLRPFLGLTGYSVFAPSGEKLNDLSVSSFRNGANYRYASFSIVSGTKFDDSLQLTFRGGDTSPPPNNSPVPCNPGFYGTGGSDCTACSVGSFNPVKNAALCQLCPAGSYQPYSQQTECLSCPSGSISRRQGLNACIPCDPGKYVATNGSSECESCPANTNNYQSLRLLYEGRLRTFNPNNKTDCLCIAGTFGPSGQACTPCDPDSSFCCFCGLDDATQIDNLKNKGVPCDQCLSGTEMPMPKQGFVLSLADNVHGVGRPSSVSGAVVVPCHSTKACFGGPLSQCQEGYEGVRCGKCQAGYTSQSSGCTKCPSRSRASAVFVILCLMPVVITLLLLEMSCRRVSLAAMAVVNYMIDILYIISSIRISWPTYISKIFLGTSFLNFDIQIFYPDCTQDAFRNFQTRVGVNLSLPLIFWVMHLVFFLLLFLARAVTGNLRAAPHRHIHGVCGKLRILHLFNEPLDLVCRRFLSSCVRILILLFPQVTTTAFSYFQCLDIADGSSKMVQFPYVNCYSSEWYHMLWAPILALIVYNFLFPLTAVMFLRRFAASTAMEKGAGFDVLWVFTMEYSPAASFWGIVELVHFTLMLLAVSLFKSGVHQACAVIVLLIIHFLWGMRSLPYRAKLENDSQGFLGIGLVSIVNLGIVIDQGWTRFSVDFSDVAAVTIVCFLFALNLHALLPQKSRRRMTQVIPINTDQLDEPLQTSPGSPVTARKASLMEKVLPSSSVEMGGTGELSAPFQSFDLESQLQTVDEIDLPHGNRVWALKTPTVSS